MFSSAQLQAPTFPMRLASWAAMPMALKDCQNKNEKVYVSTWLGVAPLQNSESNHGSDRSSPTRPGGASLCRQVFAGNVQV